MKRASIFLCLALLCAGWAWAEEEATAEGSPIAAEPAAAVEDVDLGDLDAGLEGGGCEMPDLTGLSAEEVEGLALDSGFAVDGQVNAQVPACPVTSNCPNITNCGVGAVCSLTDLGACCQTTAGPIICCVSGTIKVKRCPCVCTGSPCAIQCVLSSHVRWGCR